MRAWLFTIMHNLHANAMRYRARTPTLVSLDDAAVKLAVRPIQDDRVELRGLEAALSQLSEEQRAVILLVGLEQLSYEEAASVLDIPVGTLMSRLHRGRERLRSLTSAESKADARTVT